MYLCWPWKGPYWQSVYIREAKKKIVSNVSIKNNVHKYDVECGALWSGRKLPVFSKNQDIKTAMFFIALITFYKIT
jgi:hypothetical protein